MIHAQFIKIYHYFTTYLSHVYQIFYHEIIEKRLVKDNKDYKMMSVHPTAQSLCVATS